MRLHEIMLESAERSRAESLLRDLFQLDPIPSNGKRQSFETVLAKLHAASEAEMPKWIKDIEAAIEKTKAYWAANPPTPNAPDESSIQDRVLLELYERADQEAFHEWYGENYSSEPFDPDRAAIDGSFESWLDEEFSIRVRSDGLIAIWRLGDEIEHMIGDLPIVLYHFTSSSRIASIKRDGLVSGKRSVNRTKTPGVYLTSEASGRVIDGYVRNALRGLSKAHGVMITVKVTLDEISPDPDDADISSGNTQWITDYVAPSQIISIDRV